MIGQTSLAIVSHTLLPTKLENPMMFTGENVTFTSPKWVLKQLCYNHGAL